MDSVDEQRLNRLSGIIIGASIQVHSVVEPGLLESVYETCLAWELREQGLAIRTQVPVPIVYKGIALDAGYRVDMVIDESVVVEIKTVTKIVPVHKAQVLTYLRLLRCPLGLLLNFYVPQMRDGVKRIVNGL
jgi:GxxExxY protein